MNPEDVQAQMGLQECMTALESMNVTWPSAGRAHELLNESKMNIQEHYLESLRHSPWRNKRKTTEEAEDEPQRERSTSRGDSVDVQPRPVVGLRGEGMHVTRLKNGMLSHSSDSHRLHSPASSSYRPPIRPLQAPAGYPSSFGQQVDGLFTDTGYARWGGELPSFGQPDGQSFFGSGAAGWDGHVQQQQQQDPQPQGWSTSATRFSAEPNRAGATGAGPTSGSGGGAGPGAGGGGGGNGGGTGGGGYWQDFQPPTSFGTDMSSSLYSIMPHSTVPLQSIFQDGAFSDHHHHHHPQNYPVYSRLS